MGRAVAESKRADELRRKAASVGTAGISSEDPEAGEKIADKVVRLEAKQARMKAANAAIRKHRKAGPAEQIEALVVLGFGESAATALIEPDRSEEHTSELQSLMRISYAVFCLKKKQKQMTDC